MLASGRLVRVPPFERGLTLGDFLVPVRVGERISSQVRHAMLVGLGTLLIILGARVSFYLPGDPLVPVTLQTFGVLFGGALLGFRRGILSVLLYLVLGFVGGCALGSIPDLYMGAKSRTEWAFIAITSMLGAVAVVAAVVGLITGGAVALAVLVSVTLALWLASTVRHALPAHGAPLTGGHPAH